ncbi:unnamed protein product [Heligmosomoides polygyrus]|uniref:Myb_CC_LHEQLE domain-containing protein n=1 Tax=Heligmosomoides polygyrus TaxID=6339 RepID=A0A183G9L5_HELPZ|nr:unnamed protein product [Heligmosomoides polygyrus]
MGFGRRSLQPDSTVQPPAKMLRKSRSLRDMEHELAMRDMLLDTDVEPNPTSAQLSGSSEECMESQDDTMSRKNAVQFQERELTVLMNLYVKNYAKYHDNFSAGGKVGKGARETLHEAWAEAVSSLGVASRTKLQIEEKVKNERKKVQKFLMEERQFLALNTELQYNPTTAGKIINAAVCLRNLCILTNEAAFDSVEESASDYGDAGDVQYSGGREDGTVRGYVVQRFFMSQPRL